MKKQNKIALMRGTSAAALTALALTGGANAQDSASEERSLEEIVVTAQKRSESLNDVPISIAAMSDEAMRKTGVREMRELAEFVPNLTISSGNDSATAVRIRGVGAFTRNVGFDTRVGMYIDGVYLGQSPAQNMDILDLERVEVARGPQGTLFGKNTVAGAINLITKKPTDELSMEVRGEYGNYDSYRIGAVVNIPIAENFYSRFSFSDQHRDGTFENVTTGVAHNERDGTSLRGQLRYEGASFDINLAADALFAKRNSLSGEAVTDWSGTVMPDPGAPEEFQIANNFDNFEDRDIWGLTAEINAELGGGYAVKSITGYRDTQVFRQQDTDHSALDLLKVKYPDGYEQFSQEIQIISPDDKRFKYVAGLYYYDQTGETSRTAELGSDVSVLFSVLAPPLAPAGPLFDGKFAGTFAEVDTKSWAGFINGTYDITDRLTLGFGARYTWEKKEIDFSLSADVVNVGFPVTVASVFGVAAGPIVDGRTVANVQDSDTYKDFSPTVNLSYALTDDVNVYAKYSAAFKSGGFNIDFVNQATFDEGIDFDTETVDAFEVGIKGTAADNSIRFNLIGFWMDFDDYQLNQFIALSNNTTSISIRNAAKVRSKGLEGEITWLASQNLLLQGSVGITDATFRQFEGGGSVRHAEGIGADLTGNDLPSSPGFSAAFAAQYNQPVGNSGLEAVFRADVTHSSGYYTTADNITTSVPGGNIPYGDVDSFTLLNGRIGIESGEDWSLYFWGRNILNKRYKLTDTADFLGTITAAYGDPRTYGIELNYRF